MIKKKTKKKNKILITLCAMFIAIASVFSFVSFNKQDDLVVSADTITESFTFSGSNFSSPHYVLANDGTYRTSMASIQFNFTVVDNIVTNINFNYSSYIFYAYSDDYFYNFTVDLNNLDTNYVSPNAPQLSIPIVITTNSYSNGNISIGKPVKVVFNYDNVSWNGSLGRNEFFYYDLNGNYIGCSLYFDITQLPLGRDNDTLADTVFWKDRTYYLTNSFTESEYYKDGYSQGEISGYNKGYSEGENVGYDDGYNIGYDIGYNNGYTNGSEDTNQYTFLNLVSATIDAPIKYFQSLFNFELLGVNLQGFLTGLFTLCVIVTIIKFVI